MTHPKTKENPRFPVGDPREPYPLPFKQEKDYTSVNVAFAWRIVEKSAGDMIVFSNEMSKFIKKIESEAYSRGLRDMDKMHGKAEQPKKI